MLLQEMRLTTARCVCGSASHLCKPMVGNSGTLVIFLKAVPKCLPFFLQHHETPVAMHSAEALLTELCS